MAPFGGPSLARLVSLFRKGLKDTQPLGFGIPKATLSKKDGGFELRRLRRLLTDAGTRLKLVERRVK